jgi:organic radical activating enzyme
MNEPVRTRAYLRYAEIYITNVCNLNCTNCNRLNNYHFSGHQLWKDYAEIYEKWGDQVDIKIINILGGEPLLNPSVLDWMVGLRKIWPKAMLKITSNGTRINYWDKLYNVLLENNINLGVCTHNRERRTEIIQTFEKILTAPVSKKYLGDHSNWVNEAYNKVKSESWPECLTVDDFYKLPEYIQIECRDQHKIDPDQYLDFTSTMLLTDKNGVEVKISHAEDFVTAPLKYENNTFEVYNSDPIEAHGVCISKYCHTFSKGKLYKCHHVALLPEFLQQFNVDITVDDQKLLNSYQPLTVQDSQESTHQFIQNLTLGIPQCKLCPSSLKSQFFQSDTKKIKITKKIRNLTG